MESDDFQTALAELDASLAHLTKFVQVSSSLQLSLAVHVFAKHRSVLASMLVSTASHARMLVVCMSRIPKALQRCITRRTVSFFISLDVTCRTTTAALPRCSTSAAARCSSAVMWMERCQRCR
jgi:hypothetical protein